MRLLACRDADFLWMMGLGAAPKRRRLRLPPGGVDDPAALAVVRAIQEAVGGDDRPGTWMMVAGGEVVGLCGYGRPPSGGREVEIGYSVAPDRRRRGHASRAVAKLARIILADPAAEAVTAVTSRDNWPSQAVLARNGFKEVGRETREEDGPVILWRRERPTSRARAKTPRPTPTGFP
jgi:RimJ/RimL family protein N-acetyltransferase